MTAPLFPVLKPLPDATADFLSCCKKARFHWFVSQAGNADTSELQPMKRPDFDRIAQRARQGKDSAIAPEQS